MPQLTFQKPIGLLCWNNVSTNHGQGQTTISESSIFSIQNCRYKNLIEVVVSVSMVPNGFTLTWISNSSSLDTLKSTFENKRDSTIVNTNQATDEIIIENEDGETPLPQESPLNKPLNETDSNGLNVSKNSTPKLVLHEEIDLEHK